jgi:tetratricopeptide (TPR) repeat protein
LELAISSGDDELISRARQQSISALTRQGDLAGARAALIAQRALAEDPGAPIDRRLNFLSAEATIAAMTEDGAWLDRLGRELLLLARSVGDTYVEGRAHATLAHGAYMRRDFSAIRSNYDRAIELFTLVGELRSIRVTYINRSEIELRVGRVDEALRWLDKCRDCGDLLGGLDGVSAAEVNRIEALLLSGRVKEAREEAERVYLANRESPETRFYDQALTVLGVSETLTGDAPAGIAHLNEALAHARVREARGDVGLNLCYLVDACLESEGVDAAPYAAELKTVFEEHPEAAFHPSRYCWTLARFARAQGDEAQAERWITSGVALLREELARFDDAADVDAYSALPFNRALLAHSAAIQELA